MRSTQYLLPSSTSLSPAHRPHLHAGQRSTLVACKSFGLFFLVSLSFLGPLSSPCLLRYPPPPPKMDSINFDINEALKLYMSDPATIPTPEADGSLFDCENDPESLTNGVINPILNPIIDAVAENPDNITRSAHFDSLQFLLKCARPVRFPLPLLWHPLSSACPSFLQCGALFHIVRMS